MNTFNPYLNINLFISVCVLHETNILANIRVHKIYMYILMVVFFYCFTSSVIVLQRLKTNKLKLFMLSVSHKGIRSKLGVNVSDDDAERNEERVKHLQTTFVMPSFISLRGIHMLNEVIKFTVRKTGDIW